MKGPQLIANQSKMSNNEQYVFSNTRRVQYPRICQLTDHITKGEKS